MPRFGGLWRSEGLQRLQRAGVEEEGLESHERDAVSVGPWLFVGVAGHDDLPEVVADMAERKCLLFALLAVRDVPCGLDVDPQIALVDDKIDFIAPAAALAVDGSEHFHYADIHRIVPTDKLVEDDIFHEMRVFSLPKVEPRIPDAGVNGIILGGIVKIAVAAQIEEPGVLDKEGGFEVSEILAHGSFVAYKLAKGVYRVAQFCRICKASDVAHCRVGHGFEKCIVLELESLGDISEIDCRVEVVKILPLFGFGCHKGAFGKSSEGKIGIANLEKVASVRHRLGEFSEGKRLNVYDFAAPAKFGCDVLREQAGIGACHISVDIVALEKSVEDMVERNVGVLATCGAESRKVCAFRKYWFRMLDLVDEDIAWRIVGGKSRANFLSESDSIATKIEIIRLKIDFNDMVWGDAAFKQMLFEKIEEKEAFAATAHSDQNLDEIMVFGSYKFFQKNVSFYRHLISPGLMFRSDAQKFKTRVLYHLCGLESMAALSFCAAAQKLKARSVCGVATSIRVVGWACVDCSSGESFCRPWDARTWGK